MNQNITTVCVMGLGYIGLPTASLLATKGFKVLGCDINPQVVATINRGEIHIVEQDLDTIVRSAVNSGQLSASLEPQTSDIYIIAVPTPFKEHHKPDISYVESATKKIAPFIQPGALVILESTSPIGTTEKIAHWLSELRPDLLIQSQLDKDELGHAEPVYIAHCPERVLPGNILRELIENDRIIGGIDQLSAEKAKNFYQTFVQGDLLTTDSRTAEMSKLTENSFRDLNIAFANELSMICDSINVNVWELIALANHHPRVNILQPGPGVGGHCIAVDPWFIVDADPDNTALIRTAREVNNRKPHFIIEKVLQQIAQLKNPIIACLGLSFKANIDDFRESPAVQITLELARKNRAQLLVVEPHIDILPESLQNLQPEVELSDLDTALAKADVILLLVDHKQFAHIDSRLLADKIVIDTRGLWRLSK